MGFLRPVQAAGALVSSLISSEGVIDWGSRLSVVQGNARALDTVDLINSFLEGLEFELTDGVPCNDFSIGSLTLEEGDVQNNGDSQKKTISVQVGGVAFTCTTLGFFEISSKTTSVEISVDVETEEFGETIPSGFSITPGQSCETVLDLDLQGLEDVVQGQICPIIENLLETLDDTLSSIPLLEVASVDQIESVPAAIEQAESAFEASFAEGYQLLTKENTQEVLEHFLNQFTTSPFVGALITDLQNLLVVVTDPNLDLDAVADALEPILFTLTGQNIQVPPNVLEALAATDIFQKIVEVVQSVLAGNFQETIAPIIASLVPTAEQIDALLQQLPQEVRDFLDSVGIINALNEFINKFERDFNSTVSIDDSGSLGLDFNIEGLLELLPTDGIFGELLGLLKGNATIEESLNAFLEGKTVGDVIALAKGLPEVQQLLESLGENTTLADAIDIVKAKIHQVINDMKAEFINDGEFNFNLTSVLPPSVVEIINMVTAGAVPNGFDLSNFFPLEVITFDVPPLGAVTVSLNDADFSLGGGIDKSDAGLAAVSSLILPKLSVDGSASVSLGLIVAGSSEAFDIKLEFSFSTQEAFTFVFNFDQMLDFGLGQFRTLPDLLEITVDAAMCGVSNAGVGLSAHSVDASLNAALENVSSNFQGFLADLVNLAISLYGPAAGSVVEGVVSNVLGGSNLITIPGLEGSCARNVVSPGGGTNDGSAGSIAGLDAPVFLSIVAVVVVIAAVTVFAVLFTGSSTTEAAGGAAASTGHGVKSENKIPLGQVVDDPMEKKL